VTEWCASRGVGSLRKTTTYRVYYPEVVNIGVPGEATGQVQEIQTDGVGSIVVKQIDGGPLYACHAVATGTDANGCTTNDWEIVQVTQVMRTGSPYIYRVIFPNHGVTLYLHSLRFPSDPIMPSACINAAQTTLEDVVANDTPEPATLEALQYGRSQTIATASQIKLRSPRSTPEK